MCLKFNNLSEGKKLKKLCIKVKTTLNQIFTMYCDFMEEQKFLVKLDLALSVKTLEQGPASKSF